MLIASVSVYVVSYSPAQIPVFYNLVSSTPFRANWTFLVLLMTLSYINSAVNPVLYSVFSHNFRHLFRRLLCAVCLRRQQDATDVTTVVSDRRPVTQRHSSTSTTKRETYRMIRHGTSPMTDEIADDQIVVNSDRV